MPNKSFYIIDGHAQIYRAYFAPFRDLSSPTGEPTKATFVFTQRLLNLILDRKPDYIAMVIDHGDETVFRKEILPEYKANRQAPPDDFHPQEDRILRIVRDAGIPVFEKPGFEADDLIATFAKRLCDRGFDAFIVSNDKDLRQILTDCVKLYDPYTNTITDPAKLLADHGYTPAQAVDVQTLIGDSIDNVPGIPGVGPKTAAKLIQKYGRAEAVLEHLDELTPKMRENFEKFADRIPIARRLVTLKDDVETEFDAEACRFAGVDRETLKQHFEELGFRGLLDRLEKLPARVLATAGSAASPATSTPVSKMARFDETLFGPTNEKEERARALEESLTTSHGLAYVLVDTEEKLKTFIAELKQQKRFAFDTETDDLGAMKSNLIGMSFSWQEATGYYVPVEGPQDCEHLSLERALAELKPILESEWFEKVGHNLKYDLLVMRQVGVAMKGVALDTMIAAFLLDADRSQYGIDSLAQSVLQFRKIPTSDLIGKGQRQLSMVKCPLDKVAIYASEDADIAYRLGQRFDEDLKKFPALESLNRDVEVPLIDVLVEMERNGIAIDPAILAEQSKVLGERAQELHQKILQAAGVEFNVDSPRQLADVLYEKLKLPIRKKTKTGPSTDVEALEFLADRHPVPSLVLEYRSLVKLKNTYLDNLTDFVNPKTGRIHAHFNQTGASSGRLSCSDPNLQNIPIRTDEGRRIRLAFVPGDREKNVLLTADYSQIELRILAHLTGEPALLKAFEADEDIHRAVAAEVFNVPLEKVTREQRGYAKTINFGIIYGVTAQGLARRIEGLTRAAAEDLIRTYHARFPAIKRFFQECVMTAQTQGVVQTILGRRRPIPEIDSNILSRRNYAERLAINSVVQGSAADLIKIAMVNIHRRLKKENRPSRLLLTVHDELVFETPAAEVEREAEVVRQEMVGAMELKVPLKVDVGWGKNWQEGK
jgi:DNA polymerase-1